MFRTLLQLVGAFIGTALFAYALVFVGMIAVWEVLGVVDRDGGRGMALAFGVAPLVALLAGTAGALRMGLRVRRQAQAEAAGTLAETPARRAAPMVGAIVGALAGYVPTRLAIWLVLGRNEHDALWKVLAHAWSPLLLGLLGAVAGWRLYGRPTRPVGTARDATEG